MRYMKHSTRAFTLIELMVVIAIIGFLASVIFVTMTKVQLDARDKHRIEDLKSIEVALNLYHNDHNEFPRQSDGANGNISTNQTFIAAIKPYLQGLPVDPSAKNDPDAYYYYDAAHQCGNSMVVVVFARQMSLPENSNYSSTLNTVCGGVLDGEGRGGGTNSYNIIVGKSNG